MGMGTKKLAGARGVLIFNKIGRGVLIFVLLILV
jgi:hypothetical protein